LKVIPRAIENDLIAKTFGVSVTIRDQRHIKRVLMSLQPVDSELASRFLGELKANSLTTRSLAFYASTIKSLSSIGKHFSDLGREDIVKWATDLDRRFSPATTSVHKVLAKRFLKWVHTGSLEGREYPECVAWLKPRRPRKHLPKQILSELEVRQLVETASNQRDRAMVFVGYESGARAGELLSLRIRDIEFDRFGAVLRLNGKTGERRARLVQATPDLKVWLSMHPVKNDTDAPLWTSLRKPIRPINMRTWEGLLKNLADRADIKKHVHPHVLRHTRATHLANTLTEAQMRLHFGWTKNSDMPSVYIHLSGRDVDNAILRHYGVKIEEDKEALNALAPKRCPSCMQDNPPSARFCMNCHSPLDITSVYETQRMYEQSEDLVTKFINGVIKHASPNLMNRILSESGLGDEIKRLPEKTKQSVGDSEVVRD
jgi:integrase/recombinase XerD